MHRSVQPNAIRTSTRLNLRPWRDGYRETTKLLAMQSHAQRTTAVSIRFSNAELTSSSNGMSDDDMVSIFDSVGTDLPKLSSVHVQLDLVSVAPHRMPITAIPPLQALTSLLLEVGTNRLDSIMLMNLQLFADDYDMKGFIEAIRIHPKLKSFEMRNCKFSTKKHVADLQEVVYAHPNLNHIAMTGNAAVDTISSSKLYQHLLRNGGDITDELAMPTSGGKTTTSKSRIIRSIRSVVMIALLPIAIGVLLLHLNPALNDQVRNSMWHPCNVLDEIIHLSSSSSSLDIPFCRKPNRDASEQRDGIFGRFLSKIRRKRRRRQK
mmetsp:Transcript_24816/g.69681  ORF Transcript_24816/g.69681 Transcript_24816/m.69681 type:complete len:321 (-) Transcript_24816:191-1153(-)